MSSLVEELLERAHALSREGRACLAAELLASLHEPSDRDVEAAWDEEIRRRIAEIESGKAKLIPAEEVFDEIRQMLSAPDRLTLAELWQRGRDRGAPCASESAAIVRRDRDSRSGR